VHKKVSFEAEENQLEGVLTLPRTTGPLPGVVICHPHTLYGGDMHNNVVLAVTEEMMARGMAVLRFNFRGAGNSQGRFAQGQGEQADVLAALGYLENYEDLDPQRLGLAGYSFGAMVAINASQQRSDLQGVAAVSPVVTPGIFARLEHPLLVISGEEDDVTPLEQIRTALKDAGHHDALKVIPGADHFWWNQEETMAQEVARFFQTRFFPELSGQ